MPALEGGDRAGGRRAVGPVLAVPAVVLGPADEIEEAPARHEVMHKMTAGADPRLVAESEPEIGDPLGRHQPAIGDAAGKARRLVAEEGGAHRRVDAVGADQHIDRDALAIAEPRLGAGTPIGQADEPVAEMKALGGQARCDHRQEVGAVNGDVRRPVELFALRVERGPLQGASVLPAALVGAKRADALAVEPEAEAEAEPAQDAHGVRAHINPAADLGQLRRLLVDIDLKPGLM